MERVLMVLQPGLLIKRHRDFLGNGINSFTLKGEKFPLVYGGDAASRSCDCSSTGHCDDGCLNSTLVKEKIIYCDKDSTAAEPFHEKAIGALLLQDKVLNDFSDIYPLPTSSLNSTDAEIIMSYIKSSKNPEASILKSECLNDSSAPMVVSYSSRGPNSITHDILKPDVTAPGLDILAAWSPFSPPSVVPGDTRSVKFNFDFGTSMACPHVTGVAAYVKTFHPNWSPSAIKSALMTTAFPLNVEKSPDGEFAYGVGHIDPVKAINPGLVYETIEDDYIILLCNIYSEHEVRFITGKNINCPKDSKASPKDLNYPSMASIVANTNFTRTVTNVGVSNSTYTAKISSSPDMEVTVDPTIISFKSLNEKKSFIVTISTKKVTNRLSASLIWSDGIHVVRSPIIVYKLDQ